MYDIRVYVCTCMYVCMNMYIYVIRIHQPVRGEKSDIRVHELCKTIKRALQIETYYRAKETYNRHPRP